MSQECLYYAGWASRVYFSDNGSTAIEIAIKMAFRKYSFDHGILLDSVWNKATEKGIELKVYFHVHSIFTENFLLYGFMLQTLVLYRAITSSFFIPHPLS